MAFRASLLFAALALASCSSGAGSTEISMTADQTFEPRVFSVGAGTELVFTNDSEEPHTVTAASIPDGARYFSSGGFSNEGQARENVGEALIAPGETYTLTLDVGGTYKYLCIPHESNGMVGQIEVME